MNFLAILVQVAGGEQSKAHLMLLQLHLRLYLIIFGQTAQVREHFSGRDFDAIFRPQTHQADRCAFAMEMASWHGWGAILRRGEHLVRGIAHIHVQLS